MSTRLSQDLAQGLKIESSRRCADTQKRESTTTIKSPQGALKRYSKARKVPLKLKNCINSFHQSIQSIHFFWLVRSIYLGIINEYHWRILTIGSNRKHRKQKLHDIIWHNQQNHRKLKVFFFKKDIVIIIDIIIIIIIIIVAVIHIIVIIIIIIIIVIIITIVIIIIIIIIIIIFFYYIFDLHFPETLNPPRSVLHWKSGP